MYGAVVDVPVVAFPDELVDDADDVDDPDELELLAFPPPLVHPASAAESASAPPGGQQCSARRGRPRLVGHANSTDY